MDQKLHALFNPENIAVVGASNNPLKAGYTVIWNLNQIGYPKQVFPVTPSEKEILGRTCYPKLSQIEETIELVVLGTPARLVYDMMADLELRMQKKNDVKVIVCIAADYAETKTEEGIRRQACLMDTAKKYGIRVVGPNCIGVIDNVNRVDTTFIETTLPADMRGRKGGISFISQSGAMASAVLMTGASQPAPIRMNKFLSVGNMADIDVIDLLEYFEQDEDTRVIGMYLEGYPDGRRLMDTMARIVKKKPIVVLKVGRGSIGAAAANSHTGSLAGADAVYDAAFRQYGVTRVDTIEEMLETLQAFDAMVQPKGNRCFILTQAGGPGIYCTDAYESEGLLEFPRVTEQTKHRLREVLPPMANVCSPEGYADITAAATVEHHIESLRTVLEDENVDSVILVTVIPSFLPREGLAKGLIHLLKEEGYDKKPVYVCIMAGNYVRECRELLEQNGIRTFETPARCVTVAGHMSRYQEFQSRQRKEMECLACERENEDSSSGSRFLNELEAGHLLSEYGIPVAKSQVVQTEEEASVMAEHLDAPAVMKVLSADIQHKTDAGCVFLNVKKENVQDTFRQIICNARRYAPDAVIDGVLIQEMAESGLEVIVGMKRDPQFGPTLMVGLGGIYVEVIRDVALRLLPVSREEISHMLRETKLYQIIAGARGTRYDEEALTDILLHVAEMVLDRPSIETVDINPLFLYEEGKGAKGVDALIQTRI